MKLGVVKWYDPELGYGFIQVDGEDDIFVHHSAIRANGNDKILHGGQTVQFEAVDSDKGPQATNVTHE